MRTLLLAAVGFVVIALVSLTAARGLRAQSATADAAKLPAFDVTSVKTNNSGNGSFSGGRLPGGRISLTNVPLRLMIRTAYRLQDFQIIGGPEWINTARFDVAAKADGNPAFDQMIVMLRALLADRFELAVHNETRELPVFALVVARTDGNVGPQMKQAETDCIAGRRNAPPGTPSRPLPPGQSPTCGFDVGFGNLKGRGVNMVALASTLSDLTRRVVLDRTGLASGFDVDLTWTPDQLPQRPPGAADQPLQVDGVTIDPNGPSFFTAIQEQLGLKLESTKGRVDVLVIDRAEKPTED